MARPKVLLTCRRPDGIECHLTERYDVTSNTTAIPLSNATLREALQTQVG